jgi:hypothetical protein
MPSWVCPIAQPLCCQVLNITSIQAKATVHDGVRVIAGKSGLNMNQNRIERSSCRFGIEIQIEIEIVIRVGAAISIPISIWLHAITCE